AILDGAGPRTGKPEYGLETGQSEQRSSRSRRDVDRGVSGVSSGQLDEASLHADDRNLSPDACAPGIHCKTRRVRTPARDTDGAGSLDSVPARRDSRKCWGRSSRATSATAAMVSVPTDPPIRR